MCLIWVPRQIGIVGNEFANGLARRAAASPFTGPEQMQITTSYGEEEQGTTGKNIHALSL